MSSMQGDRPDKTFESALAQDIERLALAKQPEKDLWKGIEQALTLDAIQPTGRDLMDSHNARQLNGVKQLQSSNRFLGNKAMLAMAASFLVVVFVGWMSFESGKSLQGEYLVAALSEQHQVQKQSLLVRFKDQPASTNNWQEQIGELDEAAEAIKKALAQEPNNPALLKMLKNVYLQQMSIIERVHEPRWESV